MGAAAIAACSDGSNVHILIYLLFSVRTKCVCLRANDNEWWVCVCVCGVVCESGELWARFNGLRAVRARTHIRPPARQKCECGGKTKSISLDSMRFAHTFSSLPFAIPRTTRVAIAPTRHTHTNTYPTQNFIIYFMTITFRSDHNRRTCWRSLCIQFFIYMMLSVFGGFDCGGGGDGVIDRDFL